MVTRIIRLQTNVYWTGIALLAISLFILFITPADKELNNGGHFIINASITGLYFFVLLLSKKSIPATEKIFHWSILFTLMMVSAWALNRQMNIFESSVNWLSAMQILVCASIVVVAFHRMLPPVVNHVCLAVLGAGVPLFIYMTLYLFPLYIISLFAAIGLGISLHSFAPVLVLTVMILLALRLMQQHKMYRYSFFAGLFFSIIVTIVFCLQWASVVRSINKEYRVAITKSNQDLPTWMQIAKNISQDDITMKVLKTGIVYVQPNWDQLNIFWSMPSRRFNESSKHDPLIVIASMFATPDIDEDDRIRILESSFDARHQTQERLWSGDHLSTVHVFTNVQLWPSLQLAYQEKTITVKNNNPANSWPRQEEGIYTFYLPEGSVVSSLSLWINGVEEKAVLTTKEKAQKAYKTIVGVESRDPSVVHWQEGNTVSVRVFPVMAASSRVFKIGISTPMIKRGTDVMFQNVYFNGPSYSSAIETIHFKLNENPEGLSVPGFLTRKSDSDYEYDGPYKNYWEAGYTAKDIKASIFSFEGKSYSVRRYQKQSEAKAFDNFYLDLNQNWTKTEFRQITSVLKDRKLYVNDNGITELTAANADKLFDNAQNEKFSLFPVFDMGSTENSVLITKGSFYSPNINDLRGTPFSSKLEQLSKSGKKIYVFDIGDVLAPYLKTLREHRVLRYEKVNLEQLTKNVTESTFPIDQETDNAVVLNDAELVIDRNDQKAEGTAPDHLLRLFAYNNIMRQSAQIDKDTVTDNSAIIEEAKQAHIVTPVSSLIVLETLKDYDRFDIHASKDSLGNASLNKSGAVPEPHEWALIILFAMLLLYLGYSSKSKRVA